MKTFAKVFLIAGSEPLGSAGLQADIKAVSACGGFAGGAVTCIVDEDTTTVKDILTIPVGMIVSQALSFLEDVGADCIKTGMLYSTELIAGIEGVLERYPEIPKVIDPVMVSSGGAQLLQDDAVRAYKDRLFKMADIITPNKREAEILLGREIGPENIEDALEELCRWGNAVVVKSIPEAGGDCLSDYFYAGERNTLKVFKKEKIETKNVNGTGDTFASAIAAYIARGYRLEDAVAGAEIFIDQSIRFGAEYEFGSGFGPVHPFFRDMARISREDEEYARIKRLYTKNKKRMT